MGNNIERYIKKTAEENTEPENTEVVGAIDRMFKALEADLPFVTKSKSSFKDANKKMKEIEDGAEK